MSRLLVMEDIACWRGGRWLFEGLSLALAAGEALHLTGPNGTGKSSLIRIAAGLLTPAAGRVERAAAALADDSLALDRERSLGTALGHWAALDGRGSADVADALDALGIGQLAEVPVALLSTGQARRARLARVIASAAPLWLLDEPLNGLDGDGAARLQAALARHRAAGGAVLAASHVPLGGEWATRALHP